MIDPEVKEMDQIQIGKFIAQLRRRDGLTQEALGEKLGVTNKTVSRWENGNYMPDIGTLKLLSEQFRVSINELLAGQFLTDGEFREKADENLVRMSRESGFSIREKTEFWKKKWRRDHLALYALCIAATLAVFVLVPVLLDRKLLACLAPLAFLVEYGYLNNKMMIYVEDNVYGEAEKENK